MVEETKMVRLIYRREGKTTCFSGVISVAGAPTTPFHNLSFELTLGLVGDVLRSYPDHRLWIKREEAPYPMTLPAEIEQLLRTNVEAAIEALTLGPQRIVIRPPRTISGGLHHGMDMLSEALGEEVYVQFRHRSGVAGENGVQIEDPVTGRWLPVHDMKAFPRVLCGQLWLTLQTVTAGHRWATAKTEDILALDQPRYYLPRGWNPSGGWITHGDLEEMLSVYKKEKETV